MKKIGMLVAVEMEAVLSKYGEAESVLEENGYRIRVYKMPGYDLFVLNSGAGEIAAAAGTQQLITGHGVEMIVNFGVVGGLTPEMKKTKACIVEKIVHYDFDTSPIDPVRPGDQLRLEVDIPDNTKRFGKGHGSMIVDDREVSRISMTFAIIDPES